MSLQWKNSYKIDDAEIDAQHQALFGYANQFLAATDKAGLTASAMRFFKYTREHFAHEERLMKRLDYPALDTHVKQHEDLIEKLSTLAQRIADDTLDQPHLEAFLGDWLIKHIAGSDTKLAKFVKLKR